ncbi:MAG: GNAT family N-acetyltransferase, partial [Chthoniobacterales bacterium]
MPTPVFRQLTRREVNVTVDWAAAEGWNPGLHDAEAFWAADPEAFIGMDLDGDLIGCLSLACYDQTADRKRGFMGFFIVKPEHRGQGLGTRLWRYGRELHRARLGPAAPISMDGVFDMQPWYAKDGATFTHRNLRVAGTGQATTEADHPRLHPLTALPFATVQA